MVCRRFAGLWVATMLAVAAPLGSWGKEEGGHFHLSAKASPLAQSLVRKLNARIGESCAATAPVQTQLVLLDDAAIGVPMRLQFDALNVGEASNATIEWFTEGGAALNPRSATTLKDKQAAEQARSFKQAVTLPGYGTFKVTARVRYQMEGYTYGQDQDLYFVADANGVRVSRTNPAPLNTATEAQVQAVPAFVKLPDPVDARLYPLPEADEIQPPDFGQVFTQTTTVTGNFKTMGPTASLENAYGAQVFAIRQGDNASIGNAVVDAAGNYTISVTTTGNTNFTLKWTTTNGATQVTNYGGTEFAAGVGGYPWTTNGGTVATGGWQINDGSSNRAFSVLQAMTRGWAQSVLYMGHTPSFVQALWQNGGTDGAYYTSFTDNKIHLKEVEWTSPDVVLHEYGHHHMDSIFNQDYPPGSGGGHSFLGHYNQALAWSEGYGSYFMIMTQNEPTYNDNNPGNFISFNLENNWDGDGVANGNSDGATNSSGYDSEAPVCAMLVDISDGNQDAYDWMSGNQGVIGDIMANYSTGGHRCYNIVDWYNGWYGRGWGARPQLNGQMMAHGMRQGNDRPTLGLYAGVDAYNGGVWWWGGYGRMSYDVKNYGSQNYVPGSGFWGLLRDPSDNWLWPQMGQELTTTAITPGSTKNVWLSLSFIGPSSPLYGVYDVSAGMWRQGDSGSVWLDAGDSSNVYRNITVQRDTSPPDYCDAYDDGACQQSSSSVHVTAYSYDSQSSILGYWTRVGSTPGAGNYQDWVFNASTATSFDKTITGLSLPANTKVYVTVVARNVEGYDAFGYTDGIWSWDNTPPNGMTATDDGIVTGNGSQLHFTAHADEDMCVAAWWYLIYDRTAATYITSWVRVATGDVRDWNYTVTGLSLVQNHIYDITVSAENLAPQYGYATTDGIRYALPVTLTGRANLVGKGGNAPPLAGRYIWVGIGSTAPSYRWDQVESWNYVPMDASGNFSIPNVVFGAKRVVLFLDYPYHYKTRSVIKSISSSVATNVGTINLLPGDCNADNFVDFFDYLILSAAYETTPSDSAWDPTADINEDGSVDFFDYLLLSDEYDTEGDW